MGADDGEGPDIGDLQGRVERYYEASPLGKATMRLSNQAPDAGERERVRRHGLRIEAVLPRMSPGPFTPRHRSLIF